MSSVDADLRDKLRPNTYHPVRELVRAADVDVTDWAFDRHGIAIENPNENVYRSFMWSFGGGGQPIVLCIWYDEIDWSGPEPSYSGNTHSFQRELDRLADSTTASAEKQRLRIKLRRAKSFQSLIYESRSHRRPIRAIILTGRRVDVDNAALDSSTVSARLLDDENWYAHDFDPATTSYRLIRGIQPPASPVEDPFAGVIDPGDDEDFQDFVGTLNESEREALIKARVGQGPFRDALVRRWFGCSVSGCALLEVLVASHIKPWSRCVTLAERLGASNGLLLTPNLDKVFDRGLIAFDERFHIMLSPRLKSGVAEQLHIDRNQQLRSPRADDLQPYLRWHRENVFASS